MGNRLQGPVPAFSAPDRTLPWQRTPRATGDDPKRSAVEGIKEKSRWLRGTLADELANPESDHLGEEDKQLLKFHGSYQQEDRDARKSRPKAGVGGSTTCSWSASSSPAGR